MGRIVGIVGILLVAVTTLGGVIGLVGLGFLAPHGGEQLVGFSIGGPGLVARVPRRALACLPGPDPRAEMCRTDVAGDELRVAVRYGTPGAFDLADCAATYRGATAPCRAANVTLGGGIPRYVAFDGAALGLDAAALGAVRRQYPLDNLYEADWLRLAPRVALVLALGVALGLALAPWRRWYLRPLGAAFGGAWAFALAFIALRLLFIGTGLVA